MPTPTNRSAADRVLTAAPTNTSLGRRRRAVPSVTAALLAVLAFTSCGDDRNDTPGGSAPSADTTASTAPAGTGPGNQGELSPESEDEAPGGAVPDPRAEP
jgi:hypothetical protein